MRNRRLNIIVAGLAAIPLALAAQDAPVADTPYEVAPKAIMKTFDTYPRAAFKDTITITGKKKFRIRRGFATSATMITLDLPKDDEEKMVHKVSFEVDTDFSGTFKSLVQLRVDDGDGARLISVPVEVKLPATFEVTPPLINIAILERPQRSAILLKPAKDAKEPTWIAAESMDPLVAVVSNPRRDDGTWPLLIRLSPGTQAGQALFTHIRVRTSVDPTRVFLYPITVQQLSPPEGIQNAQRIAAIFREAGVKHPQEKKGGHDLLIFADVRGKESREFLDLFNSYLLKEYGDKFQARLVIVPTLDRESRAAALLAHAARKASGAPAFWNMVNKLRQYDPGQIERFGLRELQEVVQASGADPEMFQFVMESSRLDTIVQADILVTNALRIRSIPTVVLNREQVADWKDKEFWKRRLAASESEKDVDTPK